MLWKKVRLHQLSFWYRAQKHSAAGNFTCGGASPGIKMAKSPQKKKVIGAGLSKFMLLAFASSEVVVIVFCIGEDFQNGGTEKVEGRGDWNLK